MQTISDRQFVFIIGAARSGTTWLQAMLGAHPSVCTFGELQLYEFYTVPWVEAWKRQVELGSFNGLPTVWSEEELYDFLRQFLERVYGRVLQSNPQADVVLDKHPGNAHYVEHIDKFFPQAKFIHLIRDGRDVAVSLLAAAQGWGRLWAPSDLRAAARVWKTFVLAARKAQQFKDRYLEVKYEDLLANGVGNLQRIFEFIGVPSEADATMAIFNRHHFDEMKRRRTATNNVALPAGFFRKGQAGDWQNSLNPVQRYTFYDVAGDLLHELGYADDAWWVEHGLQRYTLPLRSVISSRHDRKSEAVHAVRFLLGPKWAGRLSAVRNRSRTLTGGAPRL